MTFGDFCVSAILFIVFITGVTSCSFYQGVHQQKNKALKAGVAYYDVNPETGETKFHFKKDCK